MELTLECGVGGRHRLHWTPDTGALIRLYRPRLDDDPGVVISEDGEWVQIATFSRTEAKELRGFIDAVDALR